VTALRRRVTLEGWCDSVAQNSNSRAGRWASRLNLPAPVRLSAEDVAHVLDRADYRCAFCDEERGPVVGVVHLWPLSKGGANVRANLAASCAYDATSKSDRTDVQAWHAGAREVRVGERRCGVCRTVKDLEDFARDARNVEGRQARCRACARAAERARKASS
jgi:hypothetical protein